MSEDPAKEIARLLGLEPLPGEGGLYRETYRAERRLPAEWLGPDYGAERSAATAIYYLLTPESFSALHRLTGDEMFHFYLGDPVEVLLLDPEGHGRVARLGPDLAAGQRPQLLVPGGAWQGSRLVPGGRLALLGTTMTPGFDAADFELGRRAELLGRYPAHAALIRALTRQP